MVSLCQPWAIINCVIESQQWGSFCPAVSHRWLQRITGQGQGRHPGVPQQHCPAGFLPAVLSLAISSGKVVSVVNNWWWNFFPQICVFAFCIYMAFALWQWISNINYYLWEKICIFIFLVWMLCLIPGAFLFFCLL